VHRSDATHRSQPGLPGGSPGQCLMARRQKLPETLEGAFGRLWQV